MKTQLSLVGDAKTLDALSRFLRAFEQVSPEPRVRQKRFVARTM